MFTAYVNKLCMLSELIPSSSSVTDTTGKSLIRDDAAGGCPPSSICSIIYKVIKCSHNTFLFFLCSLFPRLQRLEIFHESYFSTP